MLDKFPRISEMARLAATMGVDESYFNGLENDIRNCPAARDYYSKLESELQWLDADAWATLQRKARSYFGQRHKTRGWSQLVSILNEAKGYGQLRSLGCESIEFVEESDLPAPDLRGINHGDSIHVEVKTIERSDHAIKHQQVLGQGKLAFRSVDPLGDSWRKKLRSTLSAADKQLGDADRRIAYLVIEIDKPFTPSRWNETISALQEMRPPNLEIVIETRGIKTSLTPRVKTAIEKTVQAIWNLGDSMAKEVVQVTGGQLPTEADKFLQSMVALFFFAKSYKSYQAARSLWRDGFPEDALALTRSLFEANLQAHYIARDPEQRVPQFMEFDPVERYRQYLKLKQCGANEYVALVEQRPDELRALKEKHDKYELRYPGQNWWGKSIRWLAEELGQNQLVKYYSLYWYQSAQVHSGLLAMNDYLKDSGDGLLAEWLPTAERGALGAIEACGAMLAIVDCANELMSLNLSKKINDAIGEFNNLVKGLGDPIERQCGKR